MRYPRESAIGHNVRISVQGYRGTWLIKNSAPPKDHHRSLGIVLLQGPGEALFLMSEVPLYVRKAFIHHTQRPVIVRKLRLGVRPYRGTSLIRNTPSVGPYRRPMPRVLRES